MARKKPITVEALWQIERVGTPSLSPDGAQAVCSVSRYSMAENKASSSLWLLSTLGGQPRALTSFEFELLAVLMRAAGREPPAHQLIDQVRVVGKRQAVALAYYRGLVHTEIAAWLDTPLGTVKAWVRRGADQRPATGVGTRRLLVVPSPTWPRSLSPQQTTVPPPVKAHELPSASTSRAPVSPSTGVGSGRAVVVPSPIWP